MVSSFEFCLLSLVVSVYGGGWKSNYNHGSWDKLLVCDNKEFLTGVCATNNLRWCRSGGSWKANKIECLSFPGADAHREEKFVLGSNFGDMIQCNTKLGYAAISACSSGYEKYCECAGGADQDCNDQYENHSHMLKCAKGLTLVQGDTVEKSTTEFGKDISCPPGYVMYKLCASAMQMYCKNKDGELQSHVIGCIRASSGDDDVDDDFKITNAVGKWQSHGSYNKPQVISITIGTVTTEGKAMDKTETSKFGFSQDLTLGAEYTGGTATASIQLSFGFSQEFENSVRKEISSSFEENESKTTQLPCGTDDDNSWDTVYQWYWKNKNAEGEVVAIVKTNTFLCAPGHESGAGGLKPRCIPDKCMNGAKCTVCEYDYCDIVATRNSTIFHFDRKCVDHKLQREDWGNEGGHVEFHRAEQTRDGAVIEVGTVTLRRDLPYPGWTEGDAFGQWASNGTVTEWREGDQIRILADWEFSDTSAARSALSAVLGVSAAALVMLFAL